MSAPHVDPAKVEVLATVGRAFRFVWTERNDFMTLAFLPILVMAIIVTIIAGTGPVDDLEAAAAANAAGFGIFVVINFLALTYFGVAWHRRYMIPQERATARDALRWQPRHWRFLWISVLLSMGSGIAVALGLVPTFLVTPAGAALATLAVLIGVGLAAARLLILLPAAAVDDFMSFRGGWAFGRHNSWRLFTLLVLATLPVLFADVGLRLALSGLFGAAPGLLGRFVEAFVFEVAAFAGAAIGISALSSAYLQLLQGHTQVTTNPPATGYHEEDRTDDT